MIHTWHVLNLNPEAWAVGSVSIGRKAGKLRGNISPNPKLVTFQEAVREELANVKPLPEGRWKLTFYFWRERVQYVSPKGRKVTQNQVDATNMQKALEDALQGVLYDNDRTVRDVRSIIVEQEIGTDPCILIKVEPFEGLDPSEIPQHVWDKKDNVIPLDFGKDAEKYSDAEEIF